MKSVDMVFLVGSDVQFVGVLVCDCCDLVPSVGVFWVRMKNAIVRLCDL